MAEEENQSSAFTDAAGRRWVVWINATTLNRVKAACGVDMGRFAENKFRKLGELLADVSLFVNVLFVCLEDECWARNLSEEDFGRGLGGDQLEDAADAFVRAFANFSPRQARGPLLKLAKTGREYAARVSRETMEALEKIDVMTLPLPSTNSAASSPESAESIPEG